MTTERATYKGHGSPTRFYYYGRGSRPATIGLHVEARVDATGITLRAPEGAFVARFGNAMKFWASMETTS